MDCALALLALLLLCPLLLPCMLVLRLTGEGEIFYRQARIGRHGEEFALLKFATMLKDSPNQGGGLLTGTDDPRVLPFGRVLRASKLNELPQLWNIVRGDMSIIGPRPQVREHYEVYSECVRQQLQQVRPGLSGVGSIVFRDEERLLNMHANSTADYYNEVIAPYKGQVEAWYVGRQSVSLNVTLIALTVLAIVLPKAQLYKKMLKDLPEPEGLLKAHLG